MLERQREGVAKAKAEGKYKGRKPTARAKSDQILELDRQGLSREGIATQLGIGVASVYRVFKAARVASRGSRASSKLAPRRADGREQRASVEGFYEKRERALFRGVDREPNVTCDCVEKPSSGFICANRVTLYGQ
jgi:hypothetical protein